MATYDFQDFDNLTRDLTKSSALGVLGAGAGQLMGGFQNPSKKASPYLSQIAPTVTPYYQPYIDTGRQALSGVSGQYNMLMNNPTALLESLGGKFQASPGYDYMVRQAQNAADHAASAGGMLGSPAHQVDVAKSIMGLANQDYYNFIDRAMRNYEMGLGGNQGLATQGYQASSTLADTLANALLSQANLAYTGQQNQNQSRGGGLGSLLQGAMSLAPMLL